MIRKWALKDARMVDTVDEMNVQYVYEVSFCSTIADLYQDVSTATDISVLALPLFLADRPHRRPKIPIQFPSEAI